MADLVERIVEINRRVWDEWPVGIDAGNVEEVRRAAAIAVAAALKAEASEGVRRGLERALALVEDNRLADRGDGPSYASVHNNACTRIANGLRRLIPEAPVREGE